MFAAQQQLRERRVEDNARLKLSVSGLGLNGIEELPAMFQKIGRIALLIGAGIALFGAIIHWVALFADPTWAAFLRAPSWAVDSFRRGTWVGPIGGFVIGALMMLCSLYAFVGVRWIAWIPMTRLALPIIATICIARGLLVIPSILYAPTGFNIVGSSSSTVDHADIRGLVTAVL